MSTIQDRKSGTLLEPDYPYPPRYRWLKRGTIATVVLLAFLFGVRLWWGQLARKHLAAEVAAIQARREAFLLGDEIEEELADEVNAAYFIDRATNQLATTKPSPRNSNRRWIDRPPLPEWWIVMAEQAAVANASALAELRKARHCEFVQWKMAPQSANARAMVLMGPLNLERELAGIAADAALAAHFRGRDFESLEICKDLIALSEATSLDRKMLVSHLTGIGMQALALKVLLMTSTGVSIEPAADASPTTAATRQQVTELIRLLLDDSRFQAALAQSIQGEQLDQLQTLRTEAEKTWLLRPMIEYEEVRLLRRHQGVAAAISLPDLPAVLAAYNSGSRQNLSSSTLSSIVHPSYVRLLESHYKVVTERRMVAVALAVRLYAFDHDGAFPKTLEELIPNYLPNLPADPMAADQRPLGYLLLESKTRPLVYSVGGDRMDDTQAGWSPPRTFLIGWSTGGIDQWRDLSRWNVPPPTTQDDLSFFPEMGVPPSLGIMGSAPHRVEE